MAPHASTPSNSSNQLPIYQSVLLSVSGDSKISLQHTSVQQLSAIPEDRELADEDQDFEEQNYGPTVDGEYDEPHILIQDPAPDGGYGWVIVLASFFSNLIVDGIAYTFGLFFQHFLLHFNTSKSKVALCGSLLNGFYLSVGPLVGSLANRFGCRFVSILGAFIACFAFSISTIAPNIETLIFTYGVLGGIGMGMIFLPAIVSVGYYFTSKRAFATGIAVCGSGVGAFLFAPFCQYLLSVTSWQSTLLILAGLMLSCSLFGALIKPLKIHAEAVLEEDLDPQLQVNEFHKPLLQRIAEEKRRRLLAHSNSQFLLMMQQNGSLDMNDPTFNELKERLTMNTEPGVHSTLYLDQLFNPSPAPTVNSGTFCPSANQSQVQLVPEKHQLSPIMEKKVVDLKPPGESGDNLADETHSTAQLNTESGPEEAVDEEEEELEDVAEVDIDQVDCSSAPSSPKSEMTAPASPDKNDTNSIHPSITTLPQSPVFDGNRGLSFTGSGAPFRTRRSSTVRSDFTGSGAVTQSANLLHPASAANLAASGQLPVQVILTTTPSHTVANNNNKEGRRNVASQAIPVRPMAKKDIFYSGSTLQIHSSTQQMAESSATMGQSLVSIPARDIIERVQKQIQLREQEEEVDGQTSQSPFLRKRKNVCNKLMKVLCPFTGSDSDCYKPKQPQLENVEEDGEEMNGLSVNTVRPKTATEEEVIKPSLWQRLMAKIPPSMKTILFEMLDMSLLRESSAFTILAISNVIGMLGFYVPYVYITQYATSYVMDGDSLVSADRAALLISVIGITNTLGRLLFGFISDQIARNGTFLGIKMTCLELNNICVILSGISVMAVPFCTTYLMVLLDCLFFGLFISAYVCLTSIILVDMLGLDKLTNAFGLLCLFRGGSSMIGPPLAGALFDFTQSYYITFGAAGLLLIISSIMAFFINIREHTVDQEPDNECEA